MIKVGDTIPSTTIKNLTTEGMEDLDTAQFLGEGQIVLFAVPGAYTPTCSAKHLPGYVNNADALKAKGVDKIICLAVNDPFVMKHWLESHGATGIITPLADGNGDFTRALGLTMDGTAYGLSQRAQRFAMYLEDGIVKSLQVEAPGEFRVSSCEAMLTAI